MSDPAAAPPRRRNWLLIVSLCLNVVLVALIVTAILRAPSRPAAIGGGGVLAPRSIMAALPDAAGPIQKVIDAHTAKLRELRLASVRARRDAFRVLASPDYTPDKLAAALEAVRAADTALEAESIAMMRDSLATLSPADRRKIVDRVRSRSWWFRRFRPRPD
ncbi:MAG TPA: periplasmic heavy metal sensor [Rhizomicrobium sp.]|nr:periplasmic heavy metal sensor [Rhizomicrobium sp.]